MSACVIGLAREFSVLRSGKTYYASTTKHAPLVDATLPDEAGEVSPLFTPEKIMVTAPPVDADTLVADEPVMTVPHSCVDFAALKEFAPDVVAWVVCEGTEINYPVVQGADNSYYLQRLPDGTHNKLGAIFMDYRNDAGFIDGNSIIYGHHIKTGEMFGALKQYAEQAFYEIHPTITIHTETQCIEVVLFAGYVADASWEILPRMFKDASSFDDYVVAAKQRSLFNSDVEVAEGDRLVTFCTCAYNFQNARFILIGKQQPLP